MDPYAPTEEDRFSFGLWIVSNPAADPFGDAVRPPRDAYSLPVEVSATSALTLNTAPSVRPQTSGKYIS